MLKIDGQNATSALEQLRKSVLPLFVWAVGLTLISLAAAQAGSPRLVKIAEQHRLNSNVVVPRAAVLAAVLIGYAPVTLVAIASHSSAYVIWSAVLLSAPVTLPWLVGATKFDVLPSAETLKPTVAQTLVLALSLSAAVVMAVDPSQARAVGAIGIAVVGFAFWSIVLTLLFVVTPLRFGLPSLALIAPLPWLVASLLHDPNEFPRRSDKRGAPPEYVVAEVHEQFVRWALSAKVPETGSIPVYLISAEGGGLRAGYWTARILAELDVRTEGSFRSSTFAYSGVSGGSLGLAAYLGMAGKPNASTIPSMETFLGRDYLAPLLGRILLTEPFWQLLGSWGWVAARDVAFERQWERDWTSAGAAPFFSKRFLDLFPAGPGRAGPVVIFNATNSESGKRVLLANVDFGVVNNDYLFPLTTDGVRQILGDLTLAEVVHLSARFPFVSPPASIQMRVPTSTSVAPTTRLWGQVVDGGYFDNSGGLALRDIYESLTELRSAARRGEGFSSSESDINWQRARPLIARTSFRVVVIRNDPLGSSGTERNEYPSVAGSPVAGLGGDEAVTAWKAGEFARYAPVRRSLGELLAPMETVVSTRDARASATRRGLWERIDKEMHDQRYQCEIDRHIAARQPMTFPMTLSPKCVDAGDDRYEEISFGEDLSDSAGASSDEPPSTCNLNDARGVPLGWLLAPRSTKAMSCMAARSPKVGKIAEQLTTQR
ncbi:patatin-like phospholipase family protein [Bradyrhizobium sp. 157]|uniref:patatin-like phospholipase family protein n=1 Tax=Bradyrhizobium sp. 157 TaxID=2782631 RepID=UPI001FFA1DAD|nr:patatin-like phospholipase family protein [Bradyrhizobium sp. 157]MCK1641223.1 patatin-like phospholipase family protein [Bradyrhizobium sp. 157]